MTREEFPGLQVSVSVLCNFEVGFCKVFLLRNSYISGWSWLCRLGFGDSWDQNWVSEWKREQEDSHFFARGWFPYSRMPDVYERVAGAFGPGLGQNSDYWQPAQKRWLEGPGHTILCLIVLGFGQLVYFSFTKAIWCFTWIVKVTPEVRSQIRLVRYQSELVSVTYQDYLQHCRQASYIHGYSRSRNFFWK